MSKACQICGKTYQKGNLVSRGIGNRVTRRTTTRNSVNLRVNRFDIGGKKVKLILCSSCLKRLKKDEKDIEKAMKESESGEGIAKVLATAK